MRQSRSRARAANTSATSPAEPWSFSVAELLREQAQASGVPKGRRTLLRLKAGAAKMLNEMAYQNLRVADIVKAAGVSHGLFYHYFEDKQGIALDVLGDMIRLSDERYAQIHAFKDAYQSIYVPNSYYLNVYRKNVGLMRAALTLSDEFEPFRQLWNDVVDRWHSRIAHSIETHCVDAGIARPDPELLAYCLGAMIDQICRQLFVQQNPHLRKKVTSIQHLAEVLSATWFRATYARDPTAKQIEACRNLVLPERRSQ
jgi:TetR/AcrR family transcriptional regulator, transcriptional repressor for nem operon